MVFDSRTAAKEMTLTSGLQCAMGAINSFDRNDFYRFEVKGNSSSYLSVNGLSADVSLTLMDANGTALSVSNQAGTSAEAININLSTGTYYVSVSQVSGNTTYKLNLSSNGAFANITDSVNWLAGDFNGDGFEDVLRQEQGNLIDGINDVQFFLGTVGGGFQGGINIANMNLMHGNGVNLLTGDFNGDGKTDLIRQEKGSWVDGINDIQILTFQNGNFQVAATLPNMSSLNGNFVNLIAGDFNADGRTDLIRQEKGAWVDGINDVQVMLSKGGWEFSAPTSISNMESMTGNNATLVASGSDLMRLKTGTSVNGNNNDVQFRSFLNGGFSDFVNNPTDAFSKAIVSKPWEAAIAKTYVANQSVLGPLVSNGATDISPLGTTGRYSTYSTGASIHWSARTGSVLITSEMEKIYGQVGGSGTWLGMPTGNQYAWNGGVRQDFEGGYLFRNGMMSKALRANEMPFTVTGNPFADAVSRAGGTASIGDKRSEPHAWGQGDAQDFVKGGQQSTVMKLSGTSTAYVVNGDIWNKYYIAKGPTSFLGYPTSDRYEFNGGYRQDFQGGFMTLSSQSTVDVFDKSGNNRSEITASPFIAAFNRAGGASVLGYKSNEVHTWGEGEVQDFQVSPMNNSIVMRLNGSNNAYVVSGEIFAKYYRAQGPVSFLGYPTSDLFNVNGGARQNFQGGFMTRNAQGVIEVFNNAGQNRLDVLSSDFSWAQPVYLKPWSPSVLNAPLASNLLQKPIDAGVGGLGNPISDIMTRQNGNKYQSFESGAVEWDSTGRVMGAVRGWNVIPVVGDIWSGGKAVNTYRTQGASQQFFIDAGKFVLPFATAATGFALAGPPGAAVGYGAGKSVVALINVTTEGNIKAS